MFTHHHRDTLVQSPRDIGRPAAARHYDKNRRKIRVCWVQVRVVNGRVTELGVHNESTGITVVPEQLLHRHIALRDLAWAFLIIGVNAVSQILSLARADQDHAICRSQGDELRRNC